MLFTTIKGRDVLTNTFLMHSLRETFRLMVVKKTVSFSLYSRTGNYICLQGSCLHIHVFVPVQACIIHTRTRAHSHARMHAHTHTLAHCFSGSALYVPMEYVVYALDVVSFM